LGKLSLPRASAFSGLRVTPAGKSHRTGFARRLSSYEYLQEEFHGQAETQKEDRFQETPRAPEPPQEEVSRRSNRPAHTDSPDVCAVTYAPIPAGHGRDQMPSIDSPHFGQRPSLRYIPRTVYPCRSINISRQLGQCVLSSAQPGRLPLYTNRNPASRPMRQASAIVSTGVARTSLIL